MTIDDMKCSSKISIQTKNELWQLEVVVANLPEIPRGQQTSLDLIFMKMIGTRYVHIKGCTYTWSSVWIVLARESCSGKPTAQEPCASPQYFDNPLRVSSTHAAKDV